MKKTIIQLPYEFNNYFIIYVEFEWIINLPSTKKQKKNLKIKIINLNYIVINYVKHLN